MALSKPAQEALYALAAGPLSFRGLVASLEPRHEDTVRSAYRELLGAPVPLALRRGSARAPVYELTTLGQETVRTLGQEQGPRAGTHKGVDS